MEVVKQSLLPTGEDSGDHVEYRSYGSRWGILMMYSFSTFLNAVFWFSFAPISTAAEHYFGVSSTAINLFSVIFMVTYIPASILALWMADRFSLRFTMNVGAVLHMLSGGLKYLSTFAPRGGGRYSIALFGQMLAGISQPIWTNSPASLAGAWFGTADREIATTVATLFNPLGNAIATLVPTILVKQACLPEGSTLVCTDEREKHPTGDVSGMENLLLYEFLASVVLGVVMLIFFRSAPPTPPSFSAANRDRLRDEMHASPAADSVNYGAAEYPEGEENQIGSKKLSSIQQLYREAKILLADTEYLRLVGGFAIGVGLFNALMTVILQIIKPAGYTSDDAGIFGATLIGCGLLGATIAAPILDKYHVYRPALKVGIVLAFLANMYFAASIRPHNKAGLAVAFGLDGFVMLPLLPMLLSNAAEHVYPIPEESAAAVMISASQIVGIIATFVFEILIKKRETYKDIFAPASIFFVSMILLAALILIPYKGEYKRLEHDKAHQANVDASRSVREGESLLEPMI